MVSITQPVVIWARPPEIQAKRDIARPATRPPVRSNDNSRQNSRLFLGCLLVAGIGFTGFLLLKRSRKQVASPYIPQASEQIEASPSHIKITPVSEKEQMVKAGALHYLNKEVWDIEWNEDGLPKRVTISRDAVQT